MRAMHIVAAGLALMPAAASAGETVTYTYDAKGRLTNVAHAGSANAALSTTYSYDPADNRTSLTTSGAFYDAAAQRVFVVPLGGGRPVALPQP